MLKFNNNMTNSTLVKYALIYITFICIFSFFFSYHNLDKQIALFYCLLVISFIYIGINKIIQLYKLINIQL